MSVKNAIAHSLRFLSRGGKRLVAQLDAWAPPLAASAQEASPSINVASTQGATRPPDDPTGMTPSEQQARARWLAAWLISGSLVDFVERLSVVMSRLHWDENETARELIQADPSAFVVLYVPVLDGKGVYGRTTRGRFFFLDGKATIDIHTYGQVSVRTDDEGVSELLFLAMKSETSTLRPCGAGGEGHPIKTLFHHPNFIVSLDAYMLRQNSVDVEQTMRLISPTRKVQVEREFNNFVFPGPDFALAEQQSAFSSVESSMDAGEDWHEVPQGVEGLDLGWSTAPAGAKRHAPVDPREAGSEDPYGVRKRAVWLAENSPAALQWDTALDS